MGKATAVTEGQADFYAWQETEVTLESRQSCHGSLGQLGYLTASAFCNHDGMQESGAERKSCVAISKQGYRTPMYALEIGDPDTAMLAESGRWVERMAPVCDGSTYIIIASLYGFSGASGDPALARRNEKLASAAVCRAAQFLTVPYYLCTDLNQNPEECNPVLTAVQTGILVDLPADWAEDKHALQATFRKEGVYKEMSGTGTTRIDTILSNVVGAAAVTGVEYIVNRAAIFDHMAVQITLSLPRMQQQVQRAGRPIGLNVDAHAYRMHPAMAKERKQELERAAEESYMRVWKIFEPAFQEAEERGNVDEVHRLWCLVAELWLCMSQEAEKMPGQQYDIKDFYQKGVPRRGSVMPITVTDMVPKHLDESRDCGPLGVENRLLRLCAGAKGILQVLPDWSNGTLDAAAQANTIKKAIIQLVMDTVKERSKWMKEPEDVKMQADEPEVPEKFAFEASGKSRYQ